MKRTDAKRGGRGRLARGARRAAASVAGLLLAWSAEGAWAQGPDQLPPAADAAAELPKTYLNKGAIQLPIHINSRVRPMLQEVRLFVRASAAEPWQMRQKVGGAENSFTFQAPGDGEYQFTMMTVDRQGRTTPADISREAPGLIVVVDTQAPQVELAGAGADATGTLVRFDVRDPNLDPLKTSLQYQTGDRVFRPADPVAGKANLYCIPAQAVFTGMIRATAADFAGNATARELNVTQLAAGGGAPAAPSAALQTLPTPTVTELPPANRVVAAEAPDGPAGRGTARTVSATANVQVLPPPEEVVQPAPPLVTPTQAPAPGTGRPTDGLQQVEARKITPVSTPDGPVRQGPAFVQVEQLPVVSPPKTLPVPAAAAPELRRMPEVTEPRPATTAVSNRQVISAPKVTLEYQIEQVGASGVGKVEVWVTRDEGKTWNRQCEDVDRKSPVDVDLPGEGTYGISLVIGNGRGFGATAPVGGDAPQMAVEVDTTRPQVEINCTRQLVDGAAVVAVTWTARDRNLAADGVELFYATGRQGPWTPIAKGLKAEGQHRWTPPTEIGQQAYLRLTARDQAGNLSVCETADPVSLDDLSRPRGQILNISTQPRGAAPQGN